jgi:hypothetical protein
VGLLPLCAATVIEERQRVIQSLADLANSYEVVRTMGFAPFGKEAILQFAVVTLAPVAPLLLTMMPLEQLLKSLVGILFK